MREFKFFHGIIRHGLTGILEPELNYNLNFYDDITEALANEIRHEIDRNIIGNITGNYPLTSAGTITPLPLTGTINTPNGFTLTTTNTGTANYTTSTRATNTGIVNYTTTAFDNLRYLNHFINLGGGSRA
jgi:hypothetical protein